MSPIAIGAVIPLIAFHLGGFLIEAVLWPRRNVHEKLLPLLNPNISAPYHLQASILRTLFINQGFANLFLAIGAAAGLWLLANGAQEGLILVRYIGAFDIGAGLVLLLSTKARTGGAIQTALGILAVLATG